MVPQINIKGLFVGFLLLGVSIARLSAQTDSLLLENLLCLDTNRVVKKVMANPDLYRLQIIYSYVELDRWNCPKAKQYTFRIREKEYFYPASLVKLPVALLALEWLDKNGWTKDLSLHTKASSICSFKPSFNKDPVPIAQYIQKSLTVSDNRSFNELYELLGINYIHSTLQSKGYSSAQIFQRLDNCDYPTNLKNDTVYLTTSSMDTVYFRGIENAYKDFEVPNAMVGSKFFLNGKYIDSGKNFRHCNSVSIQDLHQIMQGFIYPPLVPANQQFCISERDKQFLLSCMSSFPNELDSLKYPKRNGMNNMDFKYILAGGTANNFPSNIKIFNKVGLSYGFMEDIAFVVDTDKKSGFFVSCVLFANEDGYMNDGKYEYSSVGFPFMKRLGELLYEHHRSIPNATSIPNDVLQYLNVDQRVK